MHSRDIFLKFLETAIFPWQKENLNICQCIPIGKEAGIKPNKDGKLCTCGKFQQRKEMHMVQGALRPIEFFEYVFPEESLAEVLTMLGHADGVKNDFGGWKGKMAANAVRKMLGYQEVPNIPAAKTYPFVPHNLCYGVNVFGMKKDKRHKWTEQGYEQEML